MNQKLKKSQPSNLKLPSTLLGFKFLKNWGLFAAWNLRFVFSVFFLLWLIPLFAKGVEVIPPNPSPTNSVKPIVDSGQVNEAAVPFKNRKILNYSLINGLLNIQTDHGLLQLKAYSPKIIEVINFPGRQPVPDSSEAIIMKPQPLKTTLKINAQWIEWHTDSLLVVIHKNPVFVAFIYHNDTLLQEDKGYFHHAGHEGLKFKISPGEHYFGLGERAVKKLKGNKFQLYNQAHYGYGIGEKNLNFSVPLLLSSKKYLLLFDNPQKGYADLGKTHPTILELGAVGGLMKYVFIAGRKFPDLYRSYGRLTGTQPLPPRWALGNLQSRMAYRTQSEADSIVNMMQKEDFPMDAIILDFYWFGNNIKGYLGRLDWYKPHWPNPAQMIANFRKKGIKTILITEPYIIDTLKNFRIADSLGLFATDSLGHTYNNSKFYFGPAGLLDIFKPKTQNWFWQQYQKQIKIGVAGWWGDLGEPETHPADEYCVGKSAFQIHNIYALYWEKMLFEKYRKFYPQTRLFDLNRAGYAGSQRYAVFPWSGDVSRSWGGLQAQLPVMLNMSLSGFPFVHADAGGFAMGVKNNELYTRWLQFACFSPILRPHGSGIPSEPIFFNDTTRRIVRNFIKLRYRLLPYLYTTAWESHKEGSPIIRPLFYEFPDDSTTYNITDEYFFGKDLLIAPILKAGVKSRRLYLPKGLWYSWWTGKTFIGGRWIKVKVNIETIPVFVRAGAFIPMAKAVNTTDDYSSKTLTVKFFPAARGASSESVMYEDDGKTFGAYEKGKYELLKFSQDGNKHFSFSNDAKSRGQKAIKRNINLEVVGQGKNQQMNFKLRSRKTLDLKNTN